VLRGEEELRLADQQPGKRREGPTGIELRTDQPDD
jgi:hypothetical protein